MTTDKPQGPNVKELIVQRMATLAIASGGGVAAGIEFLTDPDAIKKAARQATEEIKLIITAVRQAGEPNPWKDADDEAIAAEILRQIQEKKADAD